MLTNLLAAFPTSFLHATDIQTTSRAGNIRPRDPGTSRLPGELVSDTAATTSGATFIPAEFHEFADVAECALDEQLEVLQRRHAAASRAAARARFEVELLEQRDDIDPNVLALARRQRIAAETRSQQLLRAIDALEDRLDRQ
jgi:hypothetical protein